MSSPTQSELSTDLERTSSDAGSERYFTKSISYLPNYHEPKSLDALLTKSRNLLDQIRGCEFEIQKKESEEIFCSLLHVVNLLDIQLESIENILQDKPAPAQASILGSNQLPSLSRSQMTEHVLSDLLQWIIQNQLEKALDLVTGISTEQNNYDLWQQLQILTPKMEAILRAIPHAAFGDPDDIFSLYPDDPSLKKLSKHVTIKVYGTSEEIKKSYHKFLRNVYLGHGMVIQEELHKNSYTKYIRKYLAAAYYFFINAPAKRLTDLFITKPELFIFKLWDMVEDPVFNPMISLLLPSIEMSKEFQIDRKYPLITLELVKKFVQEKVWENYGEPIFQDITAEQILLENQSEPKVRIRLISPVKLPFNEENCETKFDELIFHIHGGGWISGSANSNQMITRPWAKMSGKPIFSISYRHAHEGGQYPKSLDDCWQAYNWLIDNAHKFGINPKKVIIIGDSAGGNMALSLSLLLIKSKRRVPDGLFLIYPALNLNANRYSPNILEAMDDPVLSYSYLELLLKTYTGDPTLGLIDPLVSPIIIHPEYLKNFPIIRIASGSKDPLHDDSLRFVDKLRKAKCDVHMTVYLDMPHGFLNFDIPGVGMPEGKRCNTDCGYQIQALLKLVDEKKHKTLN